MSHWYRFEIQSGLHVVCRAERKKNIVEILPFKVPFKGCVAREKIGALREDDKHVVCNSIHRLKALVPYLPGNESSGISLEQGS